MDNLHLINSSWKTIPFIWELFFITFRKVSLQVVNTSPFPIVTTHAELNFIKLFPRSQKIGKLFPKNSWRIFENVHPCLRHISNKFIFEEEEIKILWAGVNIFQNSPRKIGEKFPNFLGSGEEFDEIQFQACCHNLGLGSDNYLEGNFSECKNEYYPFRRYCFPWWSGIKCKLSKNVAI